MPNLKGTRLNKFISQSGYCSRRKADVYIESGQVKLNGKKAKIGDLVFSGNKVNIQYAIDDLFDEEQQEELHEYFMEAENNDIQEAVEEFDGEYEEDDLRIFRIKFMSEVAN